MLRVAIVGASGYTGGELGRLLLNHPEIEITVATSRQNDGVPLHRLYPHLTDRVDIVCRNLDGAQIVEQADFIFCAVPHKTAMDVVPTFLDAGKKVVDLSADFRLRDVNVYEQWYQPHSSAHLLEKAVYGLPELHRERIKNAQLTANPGCYPTSITLALAPLLKHRLIAPDSIVIDSKSGTSGAGRAPGVETLFCEVTDGFRAYKVGGVHRHVPEIEQNLGDIAGAPVTVSFTPHLLPVSRGILSTIYADLAADADIDTIHDYFKTMYADEPFIRVLAPGVQPATQYVRGSNYCDIGLATDARTGRVIVTSAIDNIVKGASGQAVQNMNLMCGFAEETGLQQAPLFP